MKKGIKIEKRKNKKIRYTLGINKKKIILFYNLANLNRK